MRIEDVRQRLRAAGAKPGHEQRVLRLWANALPQASGDPRCKRVTVPFSVHLPGLGIGRGERGGMKADVVSHANVARA